MLPHLIPVVHTYREIGVFFDVAQLTLLVAVAFLLWWHVRLVRQMHAICRFWLKRWWATIEVEEAAGDRQVPNASLMAPPVHSSGP
jgi:hypothetical protein